MSTSSFTAAVLVIVVANAAFAQTSKLGESCDLASQGANETATFLEFDRELRAALSKQDAGVMALLVRFPLRINDGHGAIYLHDPVSLAGRFQEVFPTEIRRAVIEQSPRKLFCNYSGIMYGNGAIWILRTHRGYGIATVNLPTIERSEQDTRNRLRFACQTDKERIIIDQASGSPPRYRSWHKPRSLLEKPDTEITKGANSIMGTGTCAYPVWTFAEGTTKVVVEGLGCSNGEEQPNDALGTLEVSIGDGPASSSPCF